MMAQKQWSPLWYQRTPQLHNPDAQEFCQSLDCILKGQRVQGYASILIFSGIRLCSSCQAFALHRYGLRINKPIVGPAPRFWHGKGWL
jgi:hypothetical protein